MTPAALHPEQSRMSPARPVSIILPCRNEAAGIEACLASLLTEFTRTRCQFIVVDGQSTDGTADIVRRVAAGHGAFLVLDNPARLQSHGLNLALERAVGEIIVRVDAHCVYPPDYVERCVALLDSKPEAANVGGVMQPVGTSAFGKAVARAMSHPAGVGNNAFHLGNRSGFAETVYLGTFRRSVFDQVGRYDPAVHPAEDAELNLRIRQSGRTIWLQNDLRVDYHPRESWGRLARQYAGYARGRAAMLARHGGSLHGRHLAPPALVLGLAGATAAAVVLSPLWLIAPALYAAAVTGVSLTDRRPMPTAVRLRLPLALATMHLAWGASFLGRLPDTLLRRRRNRRDPVQSTSSSAVPEGEVSSSDPSAGRRGAIA